MIGSASRIWLAAAVTAIVVLGSMGLVAGLSTSGTGRVAGAPIAATVGTSDARATSSPSPSSTASGLAKALAIENGLRAKGISPSRIHLPNFAGAVADTAQPVQPSYIQAPAPMGVADIGLENRSGSLVPYELNTTSVAGTVDITNLQSLYLDGDGPTTYGIQLNSVANGVTVFGNSSYEFWSQNYVDYTPSTQQLVFGDEVWNFSSLSGVFPTSSVYSFGPNGTWADFPYLYQGYGPSITIGYPFSLTLYLNTSTVADRPALYFNYTVANDTTRESRSFDYLVFNSTVGTPTTRAPVPYYQADGYHYDPIGLINDMEIDILGNDDGDTTAFFAANATISLQYWNATAAKMEEVPSAYSAGEETGETSVGLLVYSSGGTNPIGIVRTGPGFVGGLWNYSGTSGATMYTVTLHPSNAFLFVNPGHQANASEAEWVPSSAGGANTFYLPDGATYYLDFLMSEYNPAHRVETPTGTPVALPAVTLAHNASRGIYTPLFALNNAEIANISSGGAGTAANPYEIESNQYGPLLPQFGAWDDYLFPVFPGLLIANTSDWVTVTPASFEIALPSWDFASAYVAALGLPLSNDLQIQFYDDSNISLVHAAELSGWLSAFLFEFPESSVMLWNCTNMLIASDTFEDQGDALLLYGGTSNTVWGNTFVPAPVAAADPASVDDSGPWVTGVNETESGDLLYNNLFEVPVSAITPTVDPFPCDQYGICVPLNYSDQWNVSDEPASDSATVNGWTLTGSIVGTSYQGGNYWSAYGTTQNPYGVVPLTVPFNDSGWITLGGDYVPLVPFSLYPVTFEESGLPSGTPWGVDANSVIGENVSPGSITVESPNGTFPLVVIAPTGFVATAAPPTYSVLGTSVTVKVTFAPLVLLQVLALGLSVDAEWSATINGTGTGNVNVTEANDTLTMDFSVVPGTYDVWASATDYSVAPAEIVSDVGTSGAFVSFNFTARPGTLDLHVSPGVADVWVDGQPVTLAAGFASLTVPAGIASIEATCPGYISYFANISINSTSTTTDLISLTAVSMGVLGLTVTPAIATVYVDGAVVTLSSGSYSGSVAPGLHSVEAVASGYYPYYNNVTVVSSGSTNLSIDLAPVSVASSSSPSSNNGISTTAWAIIGVLAALTVIFLVGMVVFALRGRRGGGGARPWPSPTPKEPVPAPPAGPPPSG